MSREGSEPIAITLCYNLATLLTLTHISHPPNATTVGPRPGSSTRHGHALLLLRAESQAHEALPVETLPLGGSNCDGLQVGGASRGPPLLGSLQQDGPRALPATAGLGL